MLIVFLLLTQVSDSIELQKPLTAFYEQGFKDGKHLAEKKFYTGYCVGGCLIGASGGCLGALACIKISKSADLDGIVYCSAAGSFVAEVLLYRKPRIDTLPGNITSRDSLYIKEIIDGYNKIAGPRKTIYSAGGWIIGSALSLGIMYFVFGVLSGIDI
ncbi:MAG: hypothetical protein ACPL28_01290 [bacterium]